MLTHNTALYGSKIIGELIISIIYFPLWWYTKGLMNVLFYLQKFITNKEKSLAFFVWLKNIFRPMYGQYDWQGRIISVLVRTIQVIIRGIILLVWVIFSIILFLVWIFLPALITYELFYQLI